MACGDHWLWRNYARKDMVGLVGMVGVFKEEEGEEESKDEYQDAETVFYEQGALKNGAYEQQEEQSEAEHVLVV